MMNTNSQKRSTFVTVLAWIFIVLTSFSTLISIMQNIMIQTMLPTTEIDKAITASHQANDIPFFVSFMLSNFQWLFFVFFVISAATLASSVGLLKRQNWARLLFVGIMGLGIAWNIFGFVMQLIMLSSMSSIPSNAPAEFQSQFKTMSIVMAVFGAIMATGFTVLFGWIIKRLLSPSIALEFHIES